jgi:hypothetical protein
MGRAADRSPFVLLCLPQTPSYRYYDVPFLQEKKEKRKKKKEKKLVLASKVLS